MSDTGKIIALAKAVAGAENASIETDVENLKSQITQKVDKSALGNAGITATSYTTKFGGEFSVTTASDQDWLSPHALASVTGRIYKEYKYRVTFNGTEYILPQRLWYKKSSTGLKVFEYLGNLNLWISDISGVPSGTDNVPFFIVSDLNNNNSIDVLTQTAGTYTIKVEQINYTSSKLPDVLIYGDEYSPIEKAELTTSAFNGISIGVNELQNKRATTAVGYGNEITNEFAIAIGVTNEISGISGLAIGERNVVSNRYSKALGYDCISSGEHSLATGAGTTASGNYSLSQNYNTVASGNEAHAEGYGTTASAQGAHSEGGNTSASANWGHAEGLRSVASGNSSHAQNKDTLADGYYMTALGNSNVGSTAYTAWVANTSYAKGD